jgi:ribosomal protein S18 acetylase RimI-like enzyme
VTAPAPPPSRARFVVRELRWSDFDAIRETFFRFFDERTVDRELGLTLFRTPPSLSDEVTWFSGLYRRVLAGDAIVAVAERDGVAVGHCTIGRAAPTEDSEGSHVGVLGIVVDRDHRGQGIGRALLTSALGQCAGKFELVRLSVFAVNRRARRLYEEFGFVYVGTIPRAIHRGDRYFDEELMVKDLGRGDTNR